MKTTEIKIVDFKGSKTFTINRIQDEDMSVRFPFIIGFGLTKARAILENIEEIKKFVEENDKK